MTDLRAERGVNQVLEAKYLEAVTESEMQQAKASKSSFECEIARRERDDYRVRSDKLQTQLDSCIKQIQELTTAVNQKD